MHRLLVPCSALALALMGCGSASTGSIAVSITGEEFVRDGLPYTATPQPGQPVIVDGWSLTYQRWITVIDNIRLSLPGTDPAQQRVVGATVAQRRGPWAVDLVREGQTATLLPGGDHGGTGAGVPLLTLTASDAGAALDTTVRYAFSFDGVSATAATQAVNLDAAGQAALAEMVQKGYSNLIVGEATRPAGTQAPFDSYPTRVQFTFAYGGTVGYVNCQNPDNGNDPVANRGVQPRQDGTQRAVITLHSEHLYWDTLNVENPTIRFDPIAAWATGPATDARVSLEDLKAAPLLELKDSQGRPIPDRGQATGYTPKAGNLSYNANGTAGISTLRDFIVYSAQAMAHLNGEGLCFVSR